MKTVKQLVKVPKNHQVIIQLPNHWEENEWVEVILRTHPQESILEFQSELENLKKAQSDPLFAQDITEVMSDFEQHDLNEW
jgi:hypothetical protein